MMRWLATRRYNYFDAFMISVAGGLWANHWPVAISVILAGSVVSVYIERKYL